MINPDAYTTNSVSMARPPISGYPPVFTQKNGSDAAAAANFERILGEEAPAPSAPATSAGKLETNDFSFFDIFKAVIDIFNPLQHIPVIGALYRHITGDEIGPVARLAGDALYGGPVGGAVAIADIICEKTTGRDMGETLIAGLTNGNTPPDTEIAGKTNEPETISANGIIWSTIPEQEVPEKIMPVPPEMIASRMTEALDKYTQMNRTFVVPQNSEIY
ncbi:MAG: hypothetical protein V1721_05145 [Pseudomonadota bacterium]